MSSATLRVVFLCGCAAFLFSALHAIDQRNAARTLTTTLSVLRDDARQLQDEFRSYHLEYTMFSDTREIYQAAKAMGMREPSFSDGSLIYLRREER